MKMPTWVNKTLIREYEVLKTKQTKISINLDREFMPIGTIISVDADYLKFQYDKEINEKGELIIPFDSIISVEIL